MRVAFGADEHSVVTEEVLAGLLELGHQVLVIADGEPWLDVSLAVAGTVAARGADRGVLCCREAAKASGVANGVAGVRAALCADPEAARAAREGAANVLAVDIGATAPGGAIGIVAAFVGDEVGDE